MPVVSDEALMNDIAGAFASVRDDVSNNLRESCVIPIIENDGVISGWLEMVIECRLQRSGC
jgi:hypothetical protein